MAIMIVSMMYKMSKGCRQRQQSFTKPHCDYGNFFPTEFPQVEQVITYEWWSGWLVLLKKVVAGGNEGAENQPYQLPNTKELPTLLSYSVRAALQRTGIRLSTIFFFFGFGFHERKMREWLQEKHSRPESVSFRADTFRLHWVTCDLDLSMATEITSGVPMCKSFVHSLRGCDPSSGEIMHVIQAADEAVGTNSSIQITYPCRHKCYRLPARRS